MWSVQQRYDRGHIILTQYCSLNTNIKPQTVLLISFYDKWQKWSAILCNFPFVHICECSQGSTIQCCSVTLETTKVYHSGGTEVGVALLWMLYCCVSWLQYICSPVRCFPDIWKDIPQNNNNKHSQIAFPWHCYINGLVMTSRVDRAHSNVHYEGHVAWALQHCTCTTCDSTREVALRGRHY